MAALNASQLLQLAQKAGFKDKEAKTMAAIILGESSGRPDAYNPNAATGDKSYGLAQINMIGSMGSARLKQFGLQKNEQLFDPATNLAAAQKVYSEVGNKFTPWSVYTSGAYKQFLPQVEKAASTSQQVAAIQPTEATQPKAPTPDAASKTGNTFIVYTGDKSPTDFLNDFIKEKQTSDPTGLIKSSQIDPMKLLTDAFKVNYFDN
jgi:hypothetical protein